MNDKDSKGDPASGDGAKAKSPTADESIDDHLSDAVDELEFNTIPNHLTVLRIILVPIVVGLIFLRDPRADFAAALLFTIASITDFFDGYLARSYKQVTIYGKLLDPLADKFLVVSALLMLQELHRVPALVVIILVCRELAITGLRALASAEGVVIPASASAKWKTASQMVAVPLLIWHQNWKGLPVIVTGHVLLYLSLVISIWSAKDYIFDFFKALRSRYRPQP